MSPRSGKHLADVILPPLEVSLDLTASGPFNSGTPLLCSARPVQGEFGAGQLHREGATGGRERTKWVWLALGLTDLGGLQGCPPSI